jgi:pimeloyl-ACP methyl ester carboxylesterase
MPVQLI